jgi:uncharacterized membrane protein
MVEMAPVFDDARAKLKWRMFLLRARLVLDSLPKDAREDLIAELTAHAGEIALHAAPGMSEVEQADEIIARIGDPREFLAPLIADAVFRTAHPISLGLIIDVFRLYAGRGIGHLSGAVLTVGIGVLGLASCVAAIGSMFAPDRVGVFRMENGGIRLPILGDVARYGNGTQLLTPSAALLLLVCGLFLCWASLRVTRRAVVKLITAFPF